MQSMSDQIFPCGSRRSRGVLIHATFRQLRNGRFSPNLVTKRTSVSRRGIRKDIFENFHFKGHFPPKSEIETRSNRHLTQSSLQVTGCTAERILLVQGPGTFRDMNNFSLRRTVAELWSIKVAQFSDFGLFSHIKPPKSTFRWPAVAQWLHRRMITIFPCGNRRSRGALLLATQLSCDFW